MKLHPVLRELVKEHGYEVVREALLQILRQEILANVADKYNLVPHAVGQDEIKRREN